jgi:hypothetical protein
MEERQKILNPAFEYQYFEGFLKIFNEQIRTVVEDLGDESFTQGQNLLFALWTPSSVIP